MKNSLRTPFSHSQEMKKEDYELHFYSDCGLEEVSSHLHDDFYELTFFVSGESMLSIDGNVYRCTTSDCSLIPPQCEHSNQISQNRGSYDRFVLWISISKVQELALQDPDFKFLLEKTFFKEAWVKQINFKTFSSLTGILVEILEEMAKEDFGSQRIADNLLQNLLIVLARGYFIDDQIKSSKNFMDKLISYIDAHLGDDLSLETLSERFFISKYHLSRTFRKTLGVSVHQYILKKRLKAAVGLLVSPKDLMQIGEMCGFSDYSSFFRAFKKEYGESPAAYRARLVQTLSDVEQ